jgi:hypothetical protein
MRWIVETPILALPAVESGEPPRLFLAKPPKVRIEAVRIVDMSSSIRPPG